MEYREYLVQHGLAGAFGRFRPCYPVRCRRGDRVVVRTSDGLELGSVLCEATQGHAHFLPNTTVGEFVRHATPRDEEAAGRLEALGRELFADARRAADDLELPLEILDAEVLLDGRQARLHYLGAVCDPRPLMDALAERHRLLVTLHNLAEPAEEEHGGCGAGGCGSGGCGSCGTSGGCGSCHTKAPHRAVEVQHRVGLL